MSGKRTAVIWIGLGLFALGTLIGSLVALSAQSLAQAVIAAMFALFGGSLLVFMEKLSEQNQAKAAIGIFAISLGTLCGVYSGLYVNEYQLLTPPAQRFTRAQSTQATVEVRKYLKENILPKANEIDVKYRNGLLTPQDAYDQIRILVEKD